MYKILKLNNFRQFNNMDIYLGRRLTVVAGRNSTGKSTILGILANSGELKKKDGTTYTEGQFRAEFSEIFHGSKKYDASGSDRIQIDIVDENDNLLDYRKFRTAWQNDNGKDRFRVIPSKILEDGKKTEAKMQIPVIYLGLSRLFPIGEANEDKITANSINFIDEKQKVHLNDIGTKNEIKRWAANLNANIIEFKLESQFRCKGSDNYLKFIDYILGNTNNYVGKINYDIAVCDTPQELEALIKIKNAENNKSRIVAGYCWNWNKDEINNTDYHDIQIGDYGISWNLGAKQTFAIDDSINEAGCVHSVQGLEFDYVGVIIGEDLYFKDGKVCTDFQNHASSDPSFKGIKKMYKENEIMAREISDTIIKNTYRVLLTRGIKGCYIYCVNEELNNYFKEQINCIKKK